MWPLYILIVFASLTGFYQMRAVQAVPPVSATVAAPEMAQNMIVYYNKVVEFVAGQAAGYTAPGGGNVVPDASLTFPSWFVRNPLWTNKVIAGQVSVYATSKPAAGDLAPDVARLSGGVTTVGVSNAASGHLLSPIMGDLGQAYPAGIPDGVVVIQGQIN